LSLAEAAENAEKDRRLEKAEGWRIRDRRQETGDRRRLEGWLHLYTSKHLTF
jgi:hypothetical protein